MIEDQTMLDLIERAAASGCEAHQAKYAAIGDAGAAGDAWAAVPPEGRNRRLIRELAQADLGQFDSWDSTWHVTPRDMGVKLDIQSIAVQAAGCEAFASGLRAAGYAVTVRDRLD